MKKIVMFFCLIWLAQNASSQMLEVNSPTSDNLYTAVSVVPKFNPERLTLYVFGDNGLGYVSSDKCVSWKDLNIDPILKRSIRKAIWANDTMMVVSGGANNDLLKYSTDKGLTFKDMILPSGGQVLTISFMQKTFVLFHQATQLIRWNLKDNSFMVVTNHVSVQCPEFYDGTSTFGKPLVVSKKKIILKDGSPYYTYFMRKGSSYMFADWGITAPFHDLITSIATTPARDLLTFRGIVKDDNKKDKYVVYQGAFEPGASYMTPALVYFPDLAQEQYIKSSYIVPNSQAYWHCGGDDSGKNGFIIKAGTIIKSTPECSMNFVGLCAYLDDEARLGSSDNVVIVGSKGKIFSDRTDLAVPVIPETPKDDYVISDPKVKVGETALIQVSGSQKDLLYYLYKADQAVDVQPLTGTGDPLTFIYQPAASVVLTVMVKFEGKLFPLKDLANVTVETTGVKTVDLLKLSAFPNPCYNEITVESAERSNASLIDQAGRTVKQFMLDQGRNELSVADLKPGLYFLTTQKHIFKILKR